MSQSRRPAKQRPSAPAPRAKRHWLRWVIGIAVGVIVVGSLIGIAAVTLTPVPTPNEVATSEATIVYYADGVDEIGRLGEATRRSIDLADVPIDAQHAVLAAEDRTFYEHGGISPMGILRSAINNVTGGSTQGASTITQQYAKNAYLSMERSWDRKIKEALLSFKLETTASKDDILEDYLNTIFFGRDAYGIEAASLAYFRKPASELTLSESAVLAAMIKSPNGLAPEDNLPELEARWAYVLDGMLEQGWITDKQRRRADFPEIKKARAGNRLGGQTGHLLGAVTDELIAMGYDETEIQRGGLRIVSTIDRAAQKAAMQAVKKAGPDSGIEGLRIGLAAVRPGTGEVVALYGGRDFVEDQVNNATRRFAQAGSTFKPFALAAATEAEIPLNSVWQGNSPTTINGYTFENYGNTSYGSVTLLTATERSINSPYVAVEEEVGVDKVADAALRAGVPASTPGLNLDALDLTFVLGTASPSGLDMASAYATFAARGQSATPTLIKRITGANGGLLYEFTPQVQAAFDSQVADTVTYALNRVVTNGTGFAALALERPAAAKTGTTDDNKSAWFVGYTPQLATAVLMAKEDANGIPVSMTGTGGLTTVTGGSFPAAIWVAFMRAALEAEPVAELPPPPQGVYRPAQNCPTVMPADPADLPAGCPVPEVIEFGPTDEPTGEAGSNATAPTDPVDPATATPLPDDQAPGDVGPDQQAPGQQPDPAAKSTAKPKEQLADSEPPA